MGNTVLNDRNYNFEPLELFKPKPEDRVNEQELKKSIEKNRELIARIHRQEKP